MALPLKKTIESIAPALRALGKDKEVADMLDKLDAIDNTPVHLLVCGEFKRGKSTFINALLNRNVCATDVDICTSVVTIIRYGEKERAVRHFGDFSNIREEEIPIEELERYTVGSAMEINNTLFIELELPLATLRDDNLTIIDTPGVGGLDPRHAAVTTHFLPRADVALLMTDVNEPMTTTELGFFHDKVKPYAKRSALIVNKADMLDPAQVEEIRLDSIQKLTATTQCAPEDVNAIAVSSAAELCPDMDLCPSNFEAMHEMIDKLVTDYRREMKEIIKADFIDLLNLAIEPLQAQLKQIEEPDVDQIPELNRRIEETKAQIQELTEPSSEFRKMLAQVSATKHGEIRIFISGKSSEVQKIFQQLLDRPEARAENGGEWIGTQLNNVLSEVAASVEVELNRIFTEIANMPQFAGMLGADSTLGNAGVDVDHVNTTVPMNKRITPLMSGAGIITIGCCYLATGPVGIMAACAVGIYVALSNMFDLGNNHIKSELTREYQPKLATAIATLNTHVETCFAKFQSEWTAAIAERAKACKNALEEAVRNVNAVKLNVKNAASEKARIQTRIAAFINARRAAAEAEL